MCARCYTCNDVFILLDKDYKVKSNQINQKHNKKNIKFVHIRPYKVMDDYALLIGSSGLKN